VLRYPDDVAIEQPLPTELDLAVRRASRRAEVVGDLRPDKGLSTPEPLPDGLATFVQQILADGSFAREVKRIGRQDPDLATL
jgi:hypothetical protein